MRLGEGKKKRRGPKVSAGQGSERRKKEKATRFARLSEHSDDEDGDVGDVGVDGGGRGDGSAGGDVEVDIGGLMDDKGRETKLATAQNEGGVAHEEDKDDESDAGAVEPETARRGPARRVVVHLPILMDSPEEGVGTMARVREVMRQAVGPGVEIELTDDMATWSEEKLGSHFRAHAGELV